MGQKFKRDALSSKAKRVAQAEANKDVDPRFIWVRPVPELGLDRFQVCYRMGEDKPTVIARDVVKATHKQWKAYVRFQSQFGKGRGYMAKDGVGVRRGLAEVAIDAASKQARSKVARRDVWVLPAVGAKPNRFMICFNDPWNGSTNVVRHTVTADEAMWAEFCEGQEEFVPDYRAKVEAAARLRAA